MQNRPDQRTCGILNPAKGFDAGKWAMELSTSHRPLPEFIEASPVGLRLAKDLTFEEWSALAASFGSAMQTAAWGIGDWMVYGERKWGRQLLLAGEAFNPKKPDRIPSHVFDLAVESTGLDRQTLSKYAEVCRKIPIEERSIRLSFGHHRILAPLPSPKRLEWMHHLTDSESVKLPSVKRLALSVRSSKEHPRVISDAEIQRRVTAAGHDNYIPHLTKMLSILRKTIPSMDEDQRDALKQDTRQLVELLESL